MKKIILITSMFIFLSLSSTANAATTGEKIKNFFIDYFAGKAIDYVWDKATGKPNINRLYKEVNYVNRQIPEANSSLKAIVSSVTPNTSAYEFKQIVYRESSLLKNKIDNNYIKIDNIEYKINKMYSSLSQRVSSNTNEINKLKSIVGDGSSLNIDANTGKKIVLNYLMHAKRIVSLSNKEGSINLLWQNSFTDRMKKKLTLPSFKAWWGKTVKSVSYNNIKPAGKNLFSFYVKYSLQDGSSICKTDKMYLKNEFGQWKIHDMMYGPHAPCR